MIQILSGAEIDLFIPSFPELQRLFHLSPFLVQFMLSANLTVFCICTLFSGTLGDRYNRRQIMLISLCVLLLGSILCVSAPNYPVLLIGRVLQGIGMAGPTVLAYPIISDNYPIEKQAAMLGILNGVMTSVVAFAPVIGSYVALYFGWRGNFMVLLLLSLFCLVMAYLVIPNRAGNSTISLSLKAYLVLLRSPKMLIFILAICFLIVPYFLFISMSPILYMQNLGVSLAQFGYYQGAISAIFAMICLMSPYILHKFGQKKCLYTGMSLSILSVFLLIGLIVFKSQNPLMITVVLMVMAASAVFPINILFPLSLVVIEDTKGRASAVISAARLIITAITLEIVSYFYVGTFFPIGLGMIIFLSFSIICIMRLISKKWVTF